MASEDKVIASVLAGDTSEFRKLVEQFHLPVLPYTQLEGVVEGFARAQLLLPFSTASAEVYDGVSGIRVV